MAFSTGAAILEDEGTTLFEVCSASVSALSNDAVDAETTKKVTLTSKAFFATLIITFQVGVTNGALAGSFIPIFRRNKSQGGSTDDVIPSSDFPQTYVGSFPVPDSLAINTDIPISISGIPLDGSCDFFIKNQVGVSISAGWKIETDAKSFNSEL